MQKEKRKFSLFEMLSYVVISVLVVAIVITAIIIANKKHRLDEINRRNDEISGESTILSRNFEDENNFILK